MKWSFFVPITVLFLISACGGGGGGPVISPDPSLEITPNNAMQVASVAYEAALESQQFDDAGDGGFLIGSTQGIVSKIDDDLATSAKIGNSNRVSQVPIPARITSCAVSGTMTFSGNIADPLTPTLTAGDHYQSEYSACDDGFGEVMDGLVRTDIDAFSGDFFTGLFSKTSTLTIQSFQVSIFENQSATPTDVLTTNGGVTLSIDTRDLPATSTSISGESLVVDTNSSSESLTNFSSAFTVDGNFFPSPYTTTASGTLDSTQLAGVIRYSNPIMFEGLGSDYPSSGEFLVEGLGSSLLLIADNNVDVRIQIDLGADGTVDQTINTTWAELTAL